MRAKKTAKKIIDVAMLLMLPVLAAKVVLGQESHEWLGMGMFGLFILYHVMNYRWITSVIKGTYSPLRIFVTVLNFLLLLDFIVLAYSGPKMSGYVFQELPLPGSTQTAQKLHLFASQWSLILMSVHTGVHSGMHGGKAKGTGRIGTAGRKGMLVWLGRGLICAVSFFWVYAFFDLKVQNYLFLQTHFMFFDESKGLALYFAEIFCMMVLFGVIGHMTVCSLKKIKGNAIGKSGKN